MASVKRKEAYSRGVKAEKVAAQFLQLKGYKILEHRYKTKLGEIDLIARKGGLLVFAEVKAHKDVEKSLLAVTEKTRRRIEQAALAYIASHENVCDMDMRFDVLVVPPQALNFEGGVMPKLLGAFSVHHLDNAWLAGQ